MSYKQIHETFWTDPEVKKYKPMQRYLYSYFITGPHAHYSGLYYLPLVYIQNETGLSQKEIKDCTKFLVEKGHIFYDYDREVIFVKSEMPYQLDNVKDGKVILNDKHITNLKKHFTTLHKSPLIAKFIELYDYLNISYTPIDTPIDTPTDRDSVTVLVPVTVPVVVSSSEERGAGENKLGFDDFWLSYPKKKAKGDAEKAWSKINPSEHLINKILSAVQRAKTSEDWLKDSGQFIPHPATWLNRKGWEDEYNTDNHILSDSSVGIMGWADRERERMKKEGITCTQAI
jgi:hypothetical protein